MNQQFKRNKRNIHGILLLDKPTGITSNRALQQVKHSIEAKKAGHTGSLDPLATGLLPICFGEATKISSYLLEADKTYEVTAKLGIKTDSADSDGTVVEEQTVPELSKKQIQTVIESFLGDGEQIPPMYSALKVDGQRLYKLARKGEVIERKPRKVTIGPIELLSFSQESFSLRVTVSKGTYIRSLIEDIATKLGTLAHVTILRRTGVVPYHDPEMVTLAEFEEMTDSHKLEQLISIETALSHWKSVALNITQTQNLKHGKVIKTAETEACEHVLVLDEQGKALAIAEVDEVGVLKTRRLFVFATEG